MPENKIGPYRIVRLIKRGGQGRVYLGYDVRLQRQVAIKIHELPGARIARKQALAEARKASRINCPRVVQVYDLIESNDHLAIVMEYVPGCDLEELIQHDRLQVASVITVATDIAVALAAARQQKVVHGDLKAANVLITKQGRVKLVDFGIAREASSLEFSSAGSFSAITPEHLDGSSLDVRTDLFALGCLLFRLLSGQQPFYRNGSLDTELLLADKRPELQARLVREEGIPLALIDLVAQLLQRCPADRPNNTHSVRRDLRRAQQGLPLAERDSLQRQARSHFRPESPEDIPLKIPSQLRQKGKSSLERSWWSSTGRRVQDLRLSTRIALGASVLAGLVIPITLAMQDNPTRVHFEPPTINLEHHADIPRLINQQWLMDSVFRAAEAEMGPLQVSGAVKPTAYYADLAERAPELVLSVSLRCSEALCLYSISGDRNGEFIYRQVSIAPDLPEPVWRDLVMSNTRSLLK
ncbi:MAG: serine/threonine-protein kinase [Halioglobus sp.]